MTIRTYIAMIYAVAAMLATAFSQPAHAAGTNEQCAAPTVGATIDGDAALVTLTEASGDWSAWSLPAVFMMTAVEIANLPEIADLPDHPDCTDGTAQQARFAIPVHRIDDMHTVVLPVAWNGATEELEPVDPAHYEANDWPAYLSDEEMGTPSPLQVVIETDQAFETIWSDTHEIDVVAFDGRRIVTLAPDQVAGPEMFVLHYVLEDQPALAAAHR